MFLSPVRLFEYVCSLLGEWCSKWHEMFVISQSQLAIFGKETNKIKITKHIDSVTGWYFAASSVMWREFKPCNGTK